MKNLVDNDNDDNRSDCQTLAALAQLTSSPQRTRIEPNKDSSFPSLPCLRAASPPTCSPL